MAGEAIRIEGLSEVLRSFKRLEGEVPAAVRGALRAGASLVAEEAKRIAEQQGLHQSGDLVKRIHPGMRNSTAYVVDTARRRGFNYPAIYEYGGAQQRRAHGKDWMIRNRSKIGVQLIANHGTSTGHVGPRAFLYPALDAKRDEVEQLVDELLGAVLAAETI